MDKLQFSKLIETSEQQFQKLKNIQYEGLDIKVHELENSLNEFKDGGQELLSQDDVLKIGIVGQVKAGKSSFLNSLFFGGEDILPKASTPMTAGLTVIEYNDKNTFEVEYFNEKDWNVFVKQNDDYMKIANECKLKLKKENPNISENVINNEIEKRTSEKIRSAHEMVDGCSGKAKTKIGQPKDVKEFFDIADLKNVLEQYVGANGEYTSVVKSLFIKIKDDRLQKLCIVDTPGVNDPVVSRENRTRQLLHSCHGVFLLSSSSAFLDSNDISFLNSRIGGSGIGTVVILASKFDSCLQEVGADIEMNRQSHGDLFDVAELQTKKFKKRFRELSDTIDEKLRDKIKINTTSGIGYSISQKNPNNWDNMEKQVVKQMKRFYPDYFSTDKDLKETFKDLANIEDIRKLYLQELFMDNKDKIISEKIEGFFINNSKAVSDTIADVLNEYKNKQEQLNSITIAEIQKQKENQRKLFDSLKDQFAWIFREFNQNIQDGINHIGNNIRYSEVRSIPTETTEGPIRHKGWLWGHNTTDMSYRQVNTSELSGMTMDAVEEYAKKWNDEWMKLFDNMRKEMAEKLNARISSFKTKIMSTTFDDKYYRVLIDNVLDALRHNRELSIGKIIDEYKRAFNDIAQKQFSVSGTDEKSESEVPGYLESQLREHNKDLVNEFRNLTDAIKDGVKDEVEKKLGNATKKIDEMKDGFVEKLKKEGSYYLEGLERDMKDKKAALEKINDIVDCLSDLAKTFNAK